MLGRHRGTRLAGAARIMLVGSLRVSARRSPSAAAVLAITLVLAAGGVADTSASSGAAFPASAARDASTCPAKVVRLTAGTGASGGHDGVIFHLRALDTSCTVTGYPTVVAYTGRFSGYRIRAVAQPSGYLESVKGAPPVVSLADGAVASAVLGGDSVVEGACHQVSSAVLTVRTTAGAAPIRRRVTFPRRTFCGQTDSAGCFARAQRAVAEKTSALSCGRPVIGPWVPATEFFYPPAKT
jgi:hypothetical protein